MMTNSNNSEIEQVFSFIDSLAHIGSLVDH